MRCRSERRSPELGSSSSSKDATPRQGRGDQATRERVSHRVFREVAIFDRSWYNRVGVERVMGWASPEQVQQFFDLAPLMEKVMVDGGIILLKY